ncbi:MAG: Mu transposase domain-containing protein [Ilumatobacteraceae bacterium]
MVRTVAANALVSLWGNRYSVPPGLVGGHVQVRWRHGTDTITIHTAGAAVAAHHLAPRGAQRTVRLPEHTKTANHPRRRARSEAIRATLAVTACAVIRIMRTMPRCFAVYGHCAQLITFHSGSQRVARDGRRPATERDRCITARIRPRWAGDGLGPAEHRSCVDRPVLEHHQQSGLPRACGDGVGRSDPSGHGWTAIAPPVRADRHWSTTLHGLAGRIARRRADPLPPVAHRRLRAPPRPPGAPPLHD